VLVDVTQPQGLARALWIFAQMNSDLREFNPHAWKFRVHWVAQHRHFGSSCEAGVSRVTARTSQTVF